MGLFDKLFKKENAAQLPAVEVNDESIVAIADGEAIDVAGVSDEMFAQKMLGDTIAFRYTADKVTLCSPANGTLSVMFPTGHAYGITMNNGVELLVHCGVNTVDAKGDGFRVLDKKQGDKVKAGEPIVEVDVKKLAQTYDMSTMLIITNANNKVLSFIDPQPVTRGQSVIR